MRRAAVTALVLACAAVVLVLGTAANDDDSGEYRVRAIFDTGFSLVTGLNVKVAGVIVGQVSALDVTEDNKAAVVLDIQESAFQDFRRDATCAVRLQSLVGERTVECTPTQPRAAGTQAPPELPVIPDGRPGAGQRLLPVTQTSRAPDIDQLNEVYRLPYRQRLSLIIASFGTGLAGNGRALNEAIRRADPSFYQFSRVLNLLAGQNQELADLARDSDRALASVGPRSRQVERFIERAGVTARATAERRTDLEAGLQRLPTFVRELRPTMNRLGAFADQAEPVVRDLGAQAESINRLFQQLEPFSRAGIPAFRSLGEAADAGRPAFASALPVARELRRTAASARPTAADVAPTLESVRDTGGIEEASETALNGSLLINGFDAVSHWYRSGFITDRTTLCTAYALPNDATAPQCWANFYPQPQAAEAEPERPAPTRRPSSDDAQVAARTDGTESPAPPADDPATGVLDYLLGGGS